MIYLIFLAGFLAGAAGMLLDVWITGWLRTHDEWTSARESYT